MSESQDAPRRLTYIINPAAGGRSCSRLIGALGRVAPHAEILVSAARGKAAELARARRDDPGRVIVAVGGDGTVHEVGGALVGAAAALGVLPAGTGNDFAAQLAVPERIEQSGEFFDQQPIRRCDAGRIEWLDAGGGFLLHPQACIDDGLLDLCRADRLSIRRQLRILPRLFDGSHAACSGVHVGRCTSLKITSDPPSPIHADGEILTEAAVEIKIGILAAGLRVAG